MATISASRAAVTSMIVVAGLRYFGSSLMRRIKNSNVADFNRRMFSFSPNRMDYSGGQLATILLTLAVLLGSVSASADDHCDDNTKPEYDEVHCFIEQGLE